ncbi:MAG: lipopolysaccharide biosynthesis protein, partial [Bacteroidales bacterium]|nr:lipopolysaccharide biosynthesis protein [Bacteroidales bacterium]
VSINLFCGPVVNAARGIAMHICNATNSFASNFSVAMQPNIIKLYAAEKQQDFLEFTFKSMRMVFFLLLFLACPLIFEMEYVINFWLKNPPKFAVAFTKLALADAVICSISYTLGTAIQATGKIRNYQIVVGTLLLLNFPLSYFALEMGYEPQVTFYIAIFLSVASLIARLLFMQGIIGFSLTDKVFTKNFGKMMFCSAVLTGLYLIFKTYIIDFHFIINLIIEYAIGVAVILSIGLNRNEYMPYVRKVLKK